MVRFHNAVVDVYTESTTVDEYGDTVTEYTKAESIAGDVQPYTLTEDEMKLYGISAVKGNVRLFLYNGLYANIKAGNRASVKSDFTQAEEMFNIMPVNAWSRHGECLLLPVENE